MDRDLKRFDDLTSSFEKTAALVGFVNLILAIWARAPGLQIGPSPAIGLSVGGLNVGYAIVFGPLIALLTTSVMTSLLRRRHLLRCAIVKKVAEGAESEGLSPGDDLALGDYSRAGMTWVGLFADRWWRVLWYFCIPPLAALIEVIRYCDFAPSPPIASGFWDRVRVLFFSLDGWSVQPTLPTRALEGASNLVLDLPYIYSPVESWVEVGLLCLVVALAVRAAAIYFASGSHGSRA